ncbi:MAG: redoxin family protein [Alphaproteobacteria bacterium]|nr:redoxin family protein [Alphaproteobacteria bacterium]
MTLRPLFLIPLLLWLGICALMLVWILTQRGDSHVLLDKKLPSFMVGETFSDKLERPAIINFFASWCVPCRAEHRLLTELSNTELRRFRMYGIAWKDVPEKTESFLNMLGNPYDAVFPDGNGQAGQALHITGVPETLVIDREGIVRAHVAGPLAPDDLKTIRRILEAP